MIELNNCLSTNEIPLNFKKTELVIFKSPRKALFDENKVKLNEKRLY